MGYYSPDHKSFFSHAGWQVDKTLAAVAGRFVGHNPPHPCTFRAYHLGGILRGDDFRYQADFNKIFPTAKIGHFVYAWAKYWADAPSELKFDVSCASPTLLYCNSKVVFKSDIVTERYPDQRHTILIPLQAGWNQFVIRFEKTRAGFGGAFGTWLGKLHYYFLMPTPQRDGQEGWIYTDPQSTELPSLPAPGASEAETGLRWHPENAWDAVHLKLGQLHRIYGLAPGQSGLAWAKALFLRPGKHAYRLTGSHRGAIAVFINDTQVFAAPASGPIDTTIPAPFGFHDVIVKSTGDDSDWGFDLALHDAREPIPFASPCNITGTQQPWIFAGPFAPGANIDLAQLRNLNNLVPSSAGETYWRLDAPQQWVRQYNDNPLYGQWNYPLGVTLYGLFHAARALGRADLEKYVVDHIQFCADTFTYALWDRSKFGGATNVHHLLTSIDSLDDCGSFGSVLLEVAKFADIKGFRPIADYVADFIVNKQDRLPDGTFYRIRLMHVFHENTMWADDLYMSVPFLCRSYQLTHDRRFIDDAARQFLGFKQRLFIPELKIMSHIYDFRRDLATGVPWGRGNGWTLFSLSELLAVLPPDHPQQLALLAFFRDLCQGYLALQDDAGMWHQVLTHPDAYPETSCTAMFAYAFARGVQYGWLEDPAPYVKSAFKAWEAINKISIDQIGNVFGVCRGSEFSFSPSYYKNELLPNLNDTHGIGIVLLAGVEVRNLTRFLQEKNQ
jgi:rhamnogalacturonyl hydrolase YesR